MKTAIIALTGLAAFSGAAYAYDNPEAAYPYNHSTIVQETYYEPGYGEPSPSDVRGYSVKGDKQLWETESRQGKSGSDGSVDAFQRTDPGHVKGSRSGPDTNR